MLELALNYNNGPVQLKDIAQRQEISARYLERMMASLVNSGLINSTRGQNGGFNLSRDPNEINLFEVIESVEGSISPVACIDDKKMCDRIDICITRDIWMKLKKAMSDVLVSITLEDMVRMQKEKTPEKKDCMYYI